MAKNTLNLYHLAITSNFDARAKILIQPLSNLLMEEENDNFRNAVISLAQENKWREVLELNEDSRSEIARKYLWVWPSEENLKFIRDNVEKNRCTGIVSVGCGCGLLEWLIQKATSEYCFRKFS